jgi:hypothetical protein
MRFVDFKDPLTEAAMKVTNGLHPVYLENMIKMIEDGIPFAVISEKQAKYGESVVLDPSMASLLQEALDNSESQSDNNYLKINTDIRRLTTEDGETILFTELEKTNAIKGGEVDYNVGYIGEIALGVAAGSRFLNAGADAGLEDFINLAKSLKTDSVLTKAGKKGSSLQLLFEGEIAHANGKVDNLKVIIRAPGKDVRAFMEFINNPGGIEEVDTKARGAMLSAIEYAKNAKKIAAGLKQTAEDPNTNTIQVVSDGISDQKGTKADLIMEIDGARINLLSVKTGPSQLGQASGHEWIKQLKFFELVFGIDVSAFEKHWGSTTDEHLTALKKIWPIVIAKVQRLTGGDSVQKEIELVKSIANGLIRYANNFNDETGESETVDIVKLVTDPNSPGYKLMQIDQRLVAAMEKTDLIGWAPKGQMGVNISGIVKTTNAKGVVVSKNIALCRMWSTKSGTTVRTNVAGGPLLDELAVMTPDATGPKVPQPSSTSQAQTNKQTTTPPASTASVPPVTTTPAVAPTPTATASNVTNLQGSNFTSHRARKVGQDEQEKEVAEEQGAWKPYTDKHVSELERMLHLAKYSK